MNYFKEFHNIKNCIYLESNDLITIGQSAYRQHNTQTALTVLSMIGSVHVRLEFNSRVLI